MNYFIDTEFDGFGGELISLAIVAEDMRYLYLIMQNDVEAITDPWVKENIIPILYDVPDGVNCRFTGLDQKKISGEIQKFFMDEKSRVSNIHIVSDWPDDLRYFCRCIMTGPGTMISLPSFTMECQRVNAYPTGLRDAVQHNALWDALALRQYFVS